MSNSSGRPRKQPRNSGNPWETQYRQSGRIQRGAARLPEIPAGSRVLELGCGNGKTAAALSVLPIELHAIDLSHEAVRLCREAVKNAGGKAVVKAMDGLVLDYPAGYFDVVLCTHYLAHMDANDMAKAAAEAQRVLKLEGTLFFRDFGRKDFRFGTGRKVGESPSATFRRNDILTHYFTANEARGLFSDLKIVKLQSEKWTMRLRTKEVDREEIVGEFRKMA